MPKQENLGPRFGPHVCDAVTELDRLQEFCHQNLFEVHGEDHGDETPVDRILRHYRALEAIVVSRPDQTGARSGGSPTVEEMQMGNQEQASPSTPCDCGATIEFDKLFRFFAEPRVELPFPVECQGDETLVDRILREHRDLIQTHSDELVNSAGLLAAAEEEKNLLDAAWGIIANASGGDWKKEPESWQVAAGAWFEKARKFVAPRKPLAADTGDLDPRVFHPDRSHARKQEPPQA